MDYHSDHLGSSRLMTNAQGTVVAGSQSSFLPYGYEYNPQSYDNHYKFTGLERDAETGIGNELDHTFFRQYSPRLGRWMSPDPAGLAAVDMTNPQSWNRYAYVVNNPLNYVDPYGDCASIVITVTPSGSSMTQDFSGCGGRGAGNGGGQPHLPELPVDASDGGGSGDSGAVPANNGINTNPPAPPAPPVTFTCQGTATYSAIGPNQANGPGALSPQVRPVSGTVAIGGSGTFGIGKGRLRTFAQYITISPSGLNAPAYGGPAGPYTVGDIGDVNIRNAPSTRFDIYRFSTQQGALNFGIRAAPTTIVVPAITGAHCPAGFTRLLGGAPE